MSRVFKVDYIPDPDRGRPLWNAKIYVGIPNEDPTIPSNQIQLTGDIGFPVGQSIPVPQPVRTNKGGVTVYNNSPLDLNAPGQQYAIAIYDRNDNLIYNFPQVDGSVAMNTTSQEEVTGLTIWPEVGEAVIGQTIPAGTDAIRYPFNGRSTLFTIKPPVAVTGLITDITINSSGIGTLEVDNSDVYDLAEFNSYIAANDGDSQLAGGAIWPLSSQDGAKVGDSGLVNIKFLTDSSTSPGSRYELSEVVSGEITALDFSALTATVGGVSVTMKKMVTFAINDIRQFGDISSGDITNAVLAAIAQGDGTYLIPDGDYTYSLPFDFPRGFSLSAYDISRGWNCRVTYTGSTFPAVQCDTNEQFVGIRLIHGGQPTNGAGVQFGRDTNFESDSNGTRCEILGFAPNVRYSNLFNSRLSDTRVADSAGVGIDISPVSFGPDGGYVTTLTFDTLYITNNAGKGIEDTSPIQAKQLSIQNVIAEGNGDTQIKLASAQVQNVWNAYIENPANTVTAIEASNGYFEHGYINGSDFGIDFGSGSSNGAVKNYKFVGGANPNISATGGSLARWFYLERCEFSQAPALSTAQTVIYNGCSGDLPSIVPEYSFVITGTVPKFGVGTNPAMLRDSEAYIKTATAAAVPANGTLVKTFTYSGTALTAGLCALTHTAQSPIPDGLATTIMIATPASYAIKFTNNTGSIINLPETDYIIEVRRYFSLNT